MPNLDREPILDWSVSESKRLPVWWRSWIFPNNSYVSESLRKDGQFKIPFQTPEEVLAAIPPELYTIAWLVGHTTNFGLPYVRPEDESGAIVSTQEVYPEPVLIGSVESPKTVGYSIGIRDRAKCLNNCRIARVTNERVSFDWILETSDIKGEYVVNGARQSLEYFIDPQEHNLSLDLNRQEGEKSSGITVTLRRDCSDKPFVEVLYGEKIRDSHVMSFKFDKVGNLSQAHFRAKMEGSELRLVEDPRAAELVTIDYPLIVGKKHACLANFIYKQLGIPKMVDLSLCLDASSTIRQVINNFKKGADNPLREWLVFGQ